MRSVSPVPALAAVALVAFAGCLTESALDVRVDAASFTAPGAPWVAMHAGGCGMCLGAGGFDRPAEHEATFVLADGRALLVEWNVNVSGEGFHVAPHVAFDAAALSDLLALTDRSRGEVFVLGVTTGAVEPAESAVEHLRESWATTRTGTACTDYGAEYGYRAPGGETDVQDVVCPVPEGDPLHAFATTLHAVRNGLQDLRDDADA